MSLFPVTMGAGKKRVLLRGPVLTHSGYGVHARQIARWLLERTDLDVEFQAMPWGDTPWLIDTARCDGMIGKIMERTVDPKGRPYDATIQVQLPNEWDPTLGKVNVGVTAGVETDRCNSTWVDACNRMTRVVVPSTFAAKSLSYSGRLLAPPVVVPESFTDAVLGDVPTPVRDMKFSTGFNFLIFGQITGNNPENDRKNLFYTVKWLCETFKHDEDVGIVIKTNSGRNTSIDRHIVKNVLTTLLREVRRTAFPKVHLLHGDMSDDEVVDLYRHPQIKALVSLTRGEGYGLPTLEAAACDLPVIATNWSGHLDFLTSGKFIDVDCTIGQIHQSRVDKNIFMQDAKWAHPKEDDAKRKLTKFRHASVIPKEWAQEMGKSVREKFSPAAVLISWDDALGGLI